jgi:hypothetical protein
MTQVPQVPWTQACPPAHWLFDEHAVHAPLTQICPLGVAPPMNTGPPPVVLGAVVQSAAFEHAEQTPEMHVWPFAQSDPEVHVPHVFEVQPCPDWQSAAVLHVQLPLLQVPDVPQSEPVVQLPHTPFMHALPCGQSMFVLHAVAHVPLAQAWPVAQSLFAVHEQ